MKELQVGDLRVLDNGDPIPFVDGVLQSFGSSGVQILFFQTRLAGRENHVVARVHMNIMDFKRVLFAFEKMIDDFEKQHGEIKLPEDPRK